MTDEVTGQEATQAETPVDSGNDVLDFDAIGTMLEFDPFATQTAAKEETPVEGAEEQQQQTETGTATVDAGQQPVEQTPQAGTGEGAATPQPEIPEEVKVLMQQLQQAQNTIAQMQSTQQQQQQVGQQQRQQDPYAAYVPAYEYQLPEPLAQLLDSEDPAERQQGVKAIMTGISRTVHRQMLEQFQGMLSVYVPRQIEQHQQQQTLQSEIQRDFYGTYKELDNPDVRRIVATIAPQVMQEIGVSDWSPVLRDTLAQRVKAMLSLGRVPVQQQQQPPAIIDQGSRGPVVQPNDIEATLFG